MPKIKYEVRDGVAVVTLARPDKRNAIDPEMTDAIEACVDRYEADDTVRAAVLAAEMAEGSPVFCSGHDLQHFRESLGSIDEHAVETVRGGFAGLTRRVRTKPLIAAVDGLATAGGCEMALACDLIVASERAAFCIAEARWNLVASGGGGFRLPRLIGPKVAMDMLLTAEPIGGRRAFELGMVSRLVPDGEVTQAALAVAAQICANGPLSVLVSKRIVDSTVWGCSEEDAWQVLDRAAAEVGASADLAEGLAAFAEKRAPRWVGA